MRVYDTNHKIEDHIGARFGERVVLGLARTVSPTSRRQIWRVQCDCGRQDDVSANYVLRRRADRCKGCSRAVATGTASPSWKGTAHVPSTAYCHFKASADHRQIEWLITIHDVEELYVNQAGRCALTGTPLKFRTGWKYKRYANASLDRINNNLPYQRGNIWLVTSDINFAKQQLTVDKFIAMCRSVIDYADRPPS